MVLLLMNLSLIRPPNNLYSPYTIKVHGIYPRDTINAKTFAQVYPEIQNDYKTES
jgi:DNA polymerase-3 subunit epsilon